ncbi:UNVERIFIED_CONTAM: hypothetical protein Scaly_2033900 [Sesamum calycinum]|uniref:Helitron helicase-like domain-containing protein n=1 Tax=Sesamum calycinum TaxID=2727403 RepID=A0AAW2N3G9_9LAMI
MTTEQREVYLARRRHLYHLRRGNNTIPAVVADVNAYQTTSRHTQALHIEGNQGVVPLARSIPIPITIADGNRSVTSTSVAQTSGSAINTTVGTTLLRQIPLANFAQVPANQLEASTSRAQPSNNRDTRGYSSILLHGGRLLQQYVVDNYVKIETQKLRWVRFHQHDIRAELYEGLQDCLDAGENDAGNVGRRTILPSSFIGSPRDMFQRYQDAMAIVQKFENQMYFLQ